MDQMILSTAEAVKALRLSRSTLNRLRVSGNGPLFVKLGRRAVHSEPTWPTGSTATVAGRHRALV